MASFWNALTGKSSNSHFPPPGSSFSSTTDTPYPSSPSAPAGPTAEDLSAFITAPTYDPTSLHPLADLAGDTLTYISLDDPSTLLPGSNTGALPSRSFTDDLCYSTGTTYLLGLSTGGLWGFTEGLRKTPRSAPSKIKLNAVLNHITRRGPFLGNNAGVLALAFTCLNAGIGKLRGEVDGANGVLAGVLAGALWKSTRGPRAMAVAGGLTGMVAGLWQVVGRALREEREERE
ncbi:Tim17/Tim22/Tim23/Pmp24 family-domain-containing protein [Tirmania nivea]|nr:Tim17/Tim22/Tim23/Pmp24 family-domain-containing protein [Tirmania nivea]